MTTNKTLAKAAGLLGALTLLAAAVQAQAGQNSSTGNNADSSWFTIRWQVSGSTGGTTTGSTGGSGGVITGGTPRPLSEVVVINPSSLTGGGRP